MNKVRCSNSQKPHYYDADLYDACPHCGAAPESGSKIPEKRSISFKPAEETHETARLSQVTEREGGRTFGIFKKSQKSEESTSWGNSKSSVNHSVSLHSKVEKTSDEESTPVAKSSVQIPQPNSGTSVKINSVSKDDVQKSDTSQSNVSIEKKEEHIKVTSDGSGKTQGFFHIPGSDSEDAKVAPARVVENTDPCAGWLVCVKGMYFGRNFPVYAGRNSIGRNESNKIAIIGDMSVSGEKHAWIVYEPKKREFYVQPGEGSGLTYIKKYSGDELNVMGTEKVEKFDKLEIGKGLYMLIPLCCEEFSWEDYMEV